MKAIILAAGRGSRLKNLTKNKPKSFLKIFGKSMIQRQISNLKNSGITDIGIVVGYKGEKFRYLNEKIFKNSQWKNTNMVFSLFKSKNWLFNDDIIVCYSDVIFSKNVIKNLILSKSKISLPYFSGWKKNWKMRYKNPLDDLEVFLFNGRKELSQIGEKPKDYNQIMGQFMGIIKFQKGVTKKIFTIFKKLPHKIQKRFEMTKFLNFLIQSNDFKIKVMRTDSYWYEIDNYKDYKFAIRDIKKKRIRL